MRFFWTYLTDSNVLLRIFGAYNSEGTPGKQFFLSSNSRKNRYITKQGKVFDQSQLSI